jgi:pimeloyl-ACP methyl ester carboxylesterase
MATFILVHGGMHGGWCWTEVVRHLTAAGHRALAPDLPGMGTDRTPPQDVTLEMTGGFIAGLVRSQSEKVVLVGHSLGGITITEAAERVPEAIAGLVYVSAVLIPSGTAAMSTLKRTGELPPGVSLSADSATLFVDPKYARERYYNGCAEADVERALALLVPQPTRPMLDRVFHTPQRFGAIPRAYVECLDDNALALEIQRSQRAALPCDPVFAMQTSHSPFLHAPRVLSEHLIAAATAFATAPHNRLPS